MANSQIRDQGAFNSVCADDPDADIEKAHRGVLEGVTKLFMTTNDGIRFNILTKIMDDLFWLVRAVREARDIATDYCTRESALDKQTGALLERISQLEASKKKIAEDRDGLLECLNDTGKISWCVDCGTGREPRVGTMICGVCGQDLIILADQRSADVLKDLGAMGIPAPD